MAAVFVGISEFAVIVIVAVILIGVPTVVAWVTFRKPKKPRGV